MAIVKAEQLPDAFFKILGLAFNASLGSWSKAQFPFGELEQQSSSLDALNHSTRGMAKPGVALHAAEAVVSLLATMKRGGEQKHLLGLLDIVDFRGSDVRLDSGTILEGLRQPIPYPAIAWGWQVRQSDPWRQTGHINVLELIAFFNYLRYVSAQTSGHHFRLLHVLDSRVCACVLAKGRSSSKLLNRTVRRILGTTLAADFYVLPLWAISAWNFADAGSRVYPGPAVPPDAG